MLICFPSFSWFNTNSIERYAESKS